MSEPCLSVDNLRKRYGGATALDGVNFRVSEGEMFGLLGPNGAGKTTLLSILSCLLGPTGGEVRIWGRPVRTADRELRRRIGVVPQELAVYDELSGRDNLTFFGRLYGLGGTGLRERVGEILAAVGLRGQADRRVATYSGGMKRRLNLGASLVHRPRLLLLDEPTTGVDPQSRNHIFEAIRRLNGEGMTVVYTSHYMEEVQALCDRVGILDRGRLIACDAVPELLRRMEGRILLRVSDVTPCLRERLLRLPDVRLAGGDGSCLVLACRDVRETLARLTTALCGLNLEVLGIDIDEPDLERVFLGLTGSELRD